MTSLGLTTDEARRRLAEHGPNRLPPARRERLWRRVLSQFRTPVVYVLLVGLVVEAGHWLYTGARGVPVEALAIAGALAVNAVVGTWQERRSEKALDKVRALAAPVARAYRDGRVTSVPAEELVPGDAVRVEAGDRLPADGDFIEASNVLVDESVLTGESLPVGKTAGAEGASGTLLVRGRAVLHVTRTGARSAMGELAALLVRIEAGKTPLERRLHRFGNRVAAGVIALGTVFVAVGLGLEGREALADVVFFAVALAVAAVPQELPPVLALTLALGVERMSKRRALVRRLSAVEALGSVTLIATDKTGTLTENRLEVRRFRSDDAAAGLLAMAIANDADLEGGLGDPLELALLRHAASVGLDAAGERGARERVSEKPFDSAWKYMRVTVREGAGLVSYLKGAPEVLLDRSQMSRDERARWTALADAEAREGFRLIALACADGERDEALRFLGLVSLWDPPRPEVSEALRHARSAGVRVVMVTGDHPSTARAVANAIGLEGGAVLTGADLARMDDAALRAALPDAAVFARVTPAEKLRVVEAFQAGGEIVAVTGDGINDAPALKRADVGVAMGKRGSDVSREVASLVLLDDNFATIVAAIEEGRSLHANIQKFIRFMFSTSLALLLLVLVGFAGSWVLDLRLPSGTLLLPLTAIQILFINLLVDGPPSLAMGLDRNPEVLLGPPRAPEAPLLDRASLVWIVLAGGVKAGVGLSLLVVVPLLGYGLAMAQTAVFAYEYIAQLVYAYPARRLGPRVLPNPTLAWTLLAVAVAPAVVFVAPGLRAVFELEPPGPLLVGIVLAAAAVSWASAEAATRWVRARPAAA